MAMIQIGANYSENPELVVNFRYCWSSLSSELCFAARCYSGQWCPSSRQRGIESGKVSGKVPDLPHNSAIPGRTILKFLEVISNLLDLH